MKRLIIAIDCDDVLIHTTEYLVRTYNALHGTAVSLKDAHSSKNPAWSTDREDVFARLHAIQLSEEYALIEPPKETIRIIHSLARHHELHLVTARRGEVKSATERMVKEHYEGCFTSIEHVGDASKGEACRLLGADVMIDDNLHHLESAAQNGVGSLVWFGDYPWQAAQKSEFALPIRCRTWSDVERVIERLANV